MRYPRRREHSDKLTNRAVRVAKDLRPIIRRYRIPCGVSFWFFPDIPGAFWIDQRRARLSEPVMLLPLARLQLKWTPNEGITSSDVLEDFWSQQLVLNRIS